MKKNIPATKQEIADELRANEREWQAAYDRYFDPRHINRPAPRLWEKIEALDARYSELMDAYVAVTGPIPRTVSTLDELFDGPQPETATVLDRVHAIITSCLQRVEEMRLART